MFFADENDTTPITSIASLLSAQVINEQIVAFMKQLLLPEAAKRPNAAMAKQQFQRLQYCLTPRLDDFTVALDNDELIGG